MLACHTAAAVPVDHPSIGRHVKASQGRDSRLTTHARGNKPRRSKRGRDVSRVEAPTCKPETSAVREMPGAIPATPEVLAAVRQAGQTVKLDPVLLLSIARAESGFEPDARNRLSSARGLLQFTRGTWLEVVRDFGSQHGLADYAAAIRKDERSGKLSVARPAVLQTILRLRDDPKLSAALAAERMAQRRVTLERDLGQPASAPDLYLLHVLGPSGAARFLEALRQRPTASSVDVVGSITKPNMGLFVSRGCPLTVAQVYARISAFLDAGRDQYGAVLASTDAHP